ncbi:phage major capsid protein (plasmid) [Streptosporangium sandarakinum]|uniref:phage major capsid protein n=1 Tax=Streptosporangium sandarakinum TaxID=1260955 RepID=UPI003D938684
MTATASRERVRELKSALQTAAAEVTRIGSTFREEAPGKFVIPEAQRKDYLAKIDEANQIRDLLNAEEKALGIYEYLNAPASTPVAGMLAAGQGGPQYKSLATAFLESPAYKAMRENNFHDPRGLVKIDQGIYSFEGMSTKDIFTLSAGQHTGPAFGHAQDVGISERMRRPNRVRDLFPSESTTANILHGIRQTGFINNAAPVPERRAADGVSAPTGGLTDVFGRAPRSRLTFEPYTAHIATITHFEYVHNNTLADDSRIRGIIDRDMIDGVKLVEDYQVLFGNGQGENLLGITQTPGIQMYSGVSGEKKTRQLRRAMTLAILAYHDPNGVVMHPNDFEEIELEEDSNGAYRVAVSVAIGAEKRVWRLNVIDTPAMLENRYLLGSYGYGAKLYDRESVSVQVSSENATNFEENVCTIKASERVGLAVDRPESFVFGTYAE